ncbi:MAG: hypothetical protein E6Q43_05245 [Dokdonella sp.]|nr:MAG: hypothetical protein EYC71_08935 [Gammaproteobacteria bacterium]TXI73604.1 MAG: hypothetical protein E6Q43_05245 [Dokdonella sp.]
MSVTARLVAGMALLLSAPVSAEVRYGPASAITVIPTAATQFRCPGAGTKTINQLAQDGWRIVSMSPISFSGDPFNPLTATQLVLRRSPD